ncbi:MmgE/PrpD family protein [Agromyces aerolatus]|uniref:MmgE/PrpD family protein n=1 Tax=Agromyces sp. LY-1074 TaxID=3074080 RepID=UPI002864C081|nr:MULTISPECIES: MmgE/PrpD family protein [unclassified Agromyces]MDR5701856.1 MmgE/PrpD family protein [Agromyces sp. LY-1074]MDR5708071.1 MmgE/PrpD family protein [Agromyces sp. LY-1358]
MRTRTLDRGDIISTPSPALDAVLGSVTRYRDGAWADEERRRTVLCLLDSLACFSVGQQLRHFQPHAAVARAVFGSTDAGPSALRTAYLYGQAANALDFDDTLIGHPGAPIVGAVLAVAARDRLTTDDILRGIAAGYQAHWLLAAAGRPTPERAAQVRSVGVWDTVAASLAIGVALGMDDRELTRVVGVAGAHSLLPYTGKWYERPVPGVKNNLGWAAAGAVLATELAVAGQTGITRPLEGDTGMWGMAGSDRWRLDPAFFATPAVMRVGFKRYPACWHLQQFLTTMSRVLRALPHDATIESVVVRGPREVEKFCDAGVAISADVAFSLPACLSLLISGVEPGPAWDAFDERSPELVHRGKVRYERSAVAGLEVRAGGRTLDAPVETSDPLNPAKWGLSESEVVGKHHRFAQPYLPAEALLAGDAAAPSFS